MKIFAVKTNCRCKYCGQKHEYLTIQHKILVAKPENKDLLEMYASSYPTLALIELDFDFILKKNIPFIEVSNLKKRA